MLESTTEDSLSIEVKAPRACSPLEIAGFSALAAGADGVEREDLAARVGHAMALLFVRKHGRLVGVGGLQTAAVARRAQLFHEAGAAAPAAAFPLEFGWMFLSPGIRGRGVASRLAQQAAFHAARRAMPLYASCGAGNHRMQAALRSAAFVQHGSQFMWSGAPCVLFLRAFNQPALQAAVPAD